eukprot:315042-Rhodomonas_salina.1
MGLWSCAPTCCRRRWQKQKANTGNRTLDDDLSKEAQLETQRISGAQAVLRRRLDLSAVGFVRQCLQLPWRATTHPYKHTGPLSWFLQTPLSPYNLHLTTCTIWIWLCSVIMHTMLGARNSARRRQGGSSKGSAFERTGARCVSLVVVVVTMP